MQLLNFEQVAEMFPDKNAKGIKNWFQGGVLPMELTVKVGKNRYFIKEKLEEFLLNKSQESRELSDLEKANLKLKEEESRIKKKRS